MHKLAEALKELNLTSSDRVYLDIWSNSAFLGSNEDGFPVRPSRLPVDGKYHLPGDMQVAHRGVFQRILLDCTAMLDASSVANTYLLVPLPRYTALKCCEDQNHVTNLGRDDILGEIEQLPNLVRAAVSGTLSMYNIKLISLLASNSDTDLCHSVAIDLTALENWADPVHLSNELYGKLAGALLALSAESDSGPAAKRQRLESVVAPAVAPRPRRPVMPPAWVLGRGQSGAARGYFRGRSASRGRPYGSYGPTYRGRGRGGRPGRRP